MQSKNAILSDRQIVSKHIIRNWILIPVEVITATIMQQTQRWKNPCDRNSIQLRCHICKSIYHMAQNCPEKYDAQYTQEVVLYQSDFEHPEQLKTLVSESWNSAVLDSGTTNTVAGEVWYNCYITSLNKNK